MTHHRPLRSAAALLLVTAMAAVFMRFQLGWSRALVAEYAAEPAEVSVGAVVAPPEPVAADPADSVSAGRAAPDASATASFAAPAGGGGR